MGAEASENRHVTPGHRIVAFLGGVKSTAEIAGGSVKSVYRWLQPTEKGGNGGLIPGPAQKRIVRNAPVHGKAVAYADFAPRDGEAVL